MSNPLVEAAKSSVRKLFSAEELKEVPKQLTQIHTQYTSQFEMLTKEELVTLCGCLLATLPIVPQGTIASQAVRRAYPEEIQKKQKCNQLGFQVWLKSLLTPFSKTNFSKESN